MKKWLTPLLALLLVLLPSMQAHADAWFNTRKNCKLLKKYTANAETGCIPNPVATCYSHMGHCEAASAVCSWHTCLFGGGAQSNSSNGNSGFSLGGSRTKAGTYGIAAPVQSELESSGSNQITGNARFDDVTRTITLLLDRGTLTASADSMLSRFDFYVFREDTQQDDEPVRTPENTLWHGSIVLQMGKLTVEGFDPRLFKLSTNAQGLTTVTFSQVQQVVKPAVSAADFEKLVVQGYAVGNSSTP